MKGKTMHQRDRVKPTLFHLGLLLSTPMALHTLKQHDISAKQLLDRHASGDWGEVSEEDANANCLALDIGSRLLSAYTIADEVRIWIITEADRVCTTILLPSEY
jgi:hypothetical protein